MTYAKILGTGSYLPAPILTNAQLAERVDTSDEWIQSRTGIKQRHIADSSDSTTSMAEMASRRALEAAGLQPQDLDLILVATTTPDLAFPSTACLLQQRFDIGGCPALDIGAACAGFNYGLSIANQYIRSGEAKYVLVVGAEIMSRLINWQDRGTCILFGDGAGAVVLGPSEQPGIHSTHLHADGRCKDLLYADMSGEKPLISMAGGEVFKLAVTRLGEVLTETLAANQWQASDIDWLIPHQANMRIITAMAKKLNLPMERVVVTVDKHGNTSAASIPLALDHAVRTGMIKRGDRLLLESFGAGFAWGSALITY